MIDSIILLLLALGCLFSVLGVIGLFRFPDFYTRIHAAGLVSSFGFLFTGIAVLVYAISSYVAGDAAYLGFSTHLILALIVVVITATTSTHAIARSAYHSGNKPKLHIVDALDKEEQK